MQLQYLSKNHTYWNATINYWCYVSMFQVSPGVFEYVPSPVDEEVKVGVIRDTLRLMDPVQRKPPT